MRSRRLLLSLTHIVITLLLIFTYSIDAGQIGLDLHSSHEIDHQVAEPTTSGGESQLITESSSEGVGTEVRKSGNKGGVSSNLIGRALQIPTLKDRHRSCRKPHRRNRGSPHQKSKNPHQKNRRAKSETTRIHIKSEETNQCRSTTTYSKHCILQEAKVIICKRDPDSNYSRRTLLYKNLHRIRRRTTLKVGGINYRDVAFRSGANNSKHLNYSKIADRTNRHPPRTTTMTSTRASPRENNNIAGRELIPKALAKDFGAEDDVMEIDSPSLSLKKLLAEKAKANSKAAASGKRSRDRAGRSPPPSTHQVISPQTGVHVTEPSS